ncbi:hypothetical protein INR49_011110, partial [Caranx melampygus]
MASHPGGGDQDGRFNWGRVVALFYFACRLVIKALVTQVPDIIKTIISWTIDYLRENLINWIREQGGWHPVPDPPLPGGAEVGSRNTAELQTRLLHLLIMSNLLALLRLQIDAAIDELQGVRRFVGNVQGADVGPLHWAGTPSLLRLVSGSGGSSPLAGGHAGLSAGQ